MIFVFLNTNPADKLLLLQKISSKLIEVNAKEDHNLN